MSDYTKQKYLIIATLLIATLFTSTMANAAYHSNYSSWHEIKIYNKFDMLISLENTPDEIARNSETNIIHSIEQSVINKNSKEGVKIEKSKYMY